MYANDANASSARRDSSGSISSDIEQLRTPPWSQEAEMHVLSVMISDMCSTEQLAELFEMLAAEDFHAERHRKLWRTTETIYSRGDPIDPVTVTAELERTGELESIGSHQYIGELIDTAVVGANVMYWAKIIVERARRRTLIDVGGKVMQMAYEPGTSTVDELLDEAGRLMLEAVMTKSTNGLRPVRDDMYDAFEEIERRVAAGGGITGLRTGLAGIDEMTGGLQRGDMVLLAARPGSGKTSLALQIAMNAAINDQIPVAIFSIEMSRRALFYRMLCAEAMVDLSNLIRGKLQEDDYGRLGYAAGILKPAPIWVDDSATLTAMQLRARCRRMKLEQPNLGLIVVDYLQKMHGPGENRNQEITGISGGLKSVAKELDVPMLALSQLTRAPDQRQEHRPQLSDLRESGSLEQDADVVMFLYRPELYSKDAAEGETELIIGKQRNGPTGTSKLYFRKSCTKFEDMANWGNR